MKKRRNVLKKYWIISAATLSIGFLYLLISIGISHKAKSSIRIFCDSLSQGKEVVETNFQNQSVFHERFENPLLIQAALNWYFEMDTKLSGEYSVTRVKEFYGSESFRNRIYKVSYDNTSFFVLTRDGRIFSLLPLFAGSDNLKGWL